MVIHIKDLNAEVTTEEVKNNIGTILGSTNVDKFKISEFRPNVNYTHAVTINLHKLDADKI